MKYFKVEQGTDEWLKLRLGKPTASNFNKIMTNKITKSTQYEGFLNTLLAERIMGKKDALSDYKSKMMEHGNNEENTACQMYEIQTGLDTVENGIFFNDDKTIGASPDRLIGEDGILEVKCPLAKTFIEYKRMKAKCPSIYALQIQGQLWITNRKWCDFVVYHQDLGLNITRIERDEKVIDGLKKYVGKFAQDLEIEYIKMIEL